MAAFQLRVFVSATTADLRTAREAASTALQKRDIFAVSQEYLAPDERRLPELLRA